MFKMIMENMFAHPKGWLGRIGGVLMARDSADTIKWVVELLELQADDNVLEVGFGHGLGVALAAERVQSVVGIDLSETMLDVAAKRNETAIQAGRVELKQGSVLALPFDDNTFNKVFAMNTVHIWPDPIAGLQEVSRVLTDNGTIAISLTSRAPADSQQLPEWLQKAGYTALNIEERENARCVLARNLKS